MECDRYRLYYARTKFFLNQLQLTGSRILIITVIEHKKAHMKFAITGELQESTEKFTKN